MLDCSMTMNMTDELHHPGDEVDDSSLLDPFSALLNRNFQWLFSITPLSLVSSDACASHIEDVFIRRSYHSMC